MIKYVLAGVGVLCAISILLEFRNALIAAQKQITLLLVILLEALVSVNKKLQSFKTVPTIVLTNSLLAYTSFNESTDNLTHSVPLLLYLLRTILIFNCSLLFQLVISMY